MKPTIETGKTTRFLCRGALLAVLLALPRLPGGQGTAGAPAADPVAPVAPVEAFDIGSRLELFVDDHLIERMDGVRLELHSPRPSGRVLQFDQPWEGNISWNLSVFHDGERYRMYYLARSAPEYARESALRPDETLVPAHPPFLCYAESDDGITWRKPSLHLHEFNGSRNNNIVAAGSLPGTPFLDSNPAVPVAERFKALGVARADSGHLGAVIWVSADGLRWKKWRDDPVFTSALPNAFDSVNLVFWSESLDQYVCYFRYMRQGIRSFVMTTSPDLLRWTKPVAADFGSAAWEHLYTNATTPYFRAPHIFLAFPKRFMAFRKRNENTEYRGISETVFMTTRDGIRFHTFPEAFIRPGRDPRNWVHRTTSASVGVVPTASDEVSLYVSRNYTFPSAHMERFAIRTDGFVSVHADYDGGEFVTRPLRFEGGALHLNYATSAAGSIRVEIQNEHGTPLPGFRLDASPVVFGDEIDHQVTWTRPDGITDLRPLQSISREPVRLRFVLRDADLFSFQFR